MFSEELIDCTNSLFMQNVKPEQFYKEQIEKVRPHRLSKGLFIFMKSSIHKS